MSYQTQMQQSTLPKPWFPLDNEESNEGMHISGRKRKNNSGISCAESIGSDHESFLDSEGIESFPELFNPKKTKTSRKSGSLSRSSSKGKGPSLTNRKAQDTRAGRGDFTTKAAQKRFYNKLSGLEKAALINIIKVCVDNGDLMISAVDGIINDNIEISSLISELEKAKDAIFKAMPKPWKYSCSDSYLRNDFAFKRCSTSRSAFKKLLRTHVANMKKLGHVDAQLEYIMKAWNVVAELPQWIGCDKEKDMTMCLDILAGLFLQVVPKLNGTNVELQRICDELGDLASFEGEMGVRVECVKLSDAVDKLKEKIV